MIWALINDLLQRLVTFNKGDQRRGLSSILRRLNLDAGRKVLDFGCGTALFAPVFRQHRLDYTGYDIDPRLLRYAARLYPDAAFVADGDALRASAPFDLVIANCCFHHIHDEPVAVEVRRIHDLLEDHGTLVLIDLVAGEAGTPLLKRLLFKLDQGVAIRSHDEYRRLLEPHFIIDATEKLLQPLGPWAQNPLFLELAVFRCHKIPPSHDADR